MSISIVVNYYNNPQAVKLVLESYQEAWKVKPGSLELIMIDDHSDQIEEISIFENVPDLRVFRIVDNIQWNQAGARNVGALEARKRAILFMDVDHVIDADEVPELLAEAEALQLGTRVTPMRRRVSQVAVEGEALKPNINCFMILRQDFFRVGGYDEVFAGHYGCEDKFFFRCCRRLGIVDLPGKFSLTYLTGRSTKGLVRDASRNQTVISTLMAAGVRSPYAFQNEYCQISPSS